MGQTMYFQRIAKVRGYNPFAIGRFIAEAGVVCTCNDQLASSGGLVLGQRCTLVDVACSPTARVPIGPMSISRR